MPESNNQPPNHLQRKYPHLLPVDVPVWERFLAKYGLRYLRFDYDVRVGFGILPDPRDPPEIQKMTDDLTRRRIDAIGHTSGQLDIIEVTTAAGIKAIGQLITYPILYRASYQPAITLRPVLVCEKLRPDVDIVLDTLKITYFIV